MLGPSGQSWVSPFPLQGCWLPGFARFMADFTVDPPGTVPRAWQSLAWGVPPGGVCAPLHVQREE